MRVLVALIVWGAAIAGAAGLSTVVANGIHTTTTTTSGSGGGSTNGGSSSGGSTNSSGSSAASLDASAVKSTDSVSLFRTANFAHVLSLARTNLGPDARIEMLALYPGYLSMTVVQGGSETDVYINAAGSYQAIKTGGNPAGSALFGLSRLSPAAPATLAQRIATAGRTPESQLGYMVAEIDPAGGRFRWLVYPHQGNRVEYFEAAGAGAPLFEYPAGSSTGLRPVRG